MLRLSNSEETPNATTPDPVEPSFHLRHFHFHMYKYTQAVRKELCETQLRDRQSLETMLLRSVGRQEISLVTAMSITQRKRDPSFGSDPVCP